MRLYNIDANLMQFIENLYNKANSAVYLNGGIGDWFRSTVGVRQGYLLTDSLQHLSGQKYNCRTRRSPINSQHRRQNNYHLTLLMTLMTWQEKRKN